MFQDFFRNSYTIICSIRKYSEAPRLRHQVRMAHEIFIYRNRFCTKRERGQGNRIATGKGPRSQGTVNIPEDNNTRAIIKITIANTDIVLSIAVLKHFILINTFNSYNNSLEETLLLLLLYRQRN